MIFNPYNKTEVTARSLQLPDYFVTLEISPQIIDKALHDHNDIAHNKMPRYRREDRAMRPIAYGCSEKNCESLATPTANFPDI